MIDPKELMIGNWVINNKYGSYIQVETIAYNGIDLEADKDGWLSPSVYAERMDPIPLTAELLEKAGFKEVERMGRISNDLFSVWTKDGVDIHDNHEYTFYVRASERSFNGGIKVKSLHQLQNLFLTIAGKHLEIVP